MDSLRSSTMRSTHVRVEDVSSASGLQERVNDFQSITTTLVDSFVASSADPATRYSVTFEMTIKPLPEERSTSDSHPPTDGSGR